MWLEDIRWRSIAATLKVVCFVFCSLSCSANWIISSLIILNYMNHSDRDIAVQNMSIVITRNHDLFWSFPNLKLLLSLHFLPEKWHRFEHPNQKGKIAYLILISSISSLVLFAFSSSNSHSRIENRNLSRQSAKLIDATCVRSLRIQKYPSLSIRYWYWNYSHLLCNGCSIVSVGNLRSTIVRNRKIKLSLPFLRMYPWLILVSNRIGWLGI